MKKLISVAVLCSMLVTAMYAQTGSNKKPKTDGKPRKEDRQKLSPEQRAQRWVDELDKAVGLSAEQKLKVSQLAIEKAKKADAIRAKFSGQKENKEAMKAEIEQLRKAFRQSIKSLLDEKQLEKLKAKNKELKDKKNTPKRDLLDDQE